jgi:hypothetical protein
MSLNARENAYDTSNLGPSKFPQQPLYELGLVYRWALGAPITVGRDVPSVECQQTHW